MGPPSIESKEKCPYFCKGCMVNDLLYFVEGKVDYETKNQEMKVEKLMDKYLKKVKKLVPALAEDVEEEIDLINIKGKSAVEDLKKRIYNSWCNKNYSNCPQYEYLEKKDFLGEGGNISLLNLIRGRLSED